MQLEIRGLTKTFAGMRALNNLDLTIDGSGSLAVIGPLEAAKPPCCAFSADWKRRIAGASS